MRYRIKMKNTAIYRRKPSAPMRYLQENNLVQGPALDFGSGRGFDARHYNMWAYDIHPNLYSDYLKDYKFQTVTCIYVLNTVFKKEEKKILKHISHLLKDNGTAYVAVRRDIRGAKFGKGGAYQRRVYMDLPLVTENKDFAIYKFTRYDILDS